MGKMYIDPRWLYTIARFVQNYLIRFGWRYSRIQKVQGATWLRSAWDINNCPADILEDVYIHNMVGRWKMK